MELTSNVAFACGLVFSLGMIAGGMLDPANVLGFLDVAGAWNPSLVFVLGGAVCVAFCGVQLQKRLTRPVCEKSFQLPTAQQIDAPLVVGSCLFGLGWGMVGICPGPAIASLVLGQWQSFVFIAGMVLGMGAFAWVS